MHPLDMIESAKSEKQLLLACKMAKIPVATYSPGDGITRYRFCSDMAPVHDGYYDYFTGRSESHATVLGLRDAKAFALGFYHGMKRSSRND